MRMMVALLFAAVLHGMLLEGAALVASRAGTPTPSISKNDDLDALDIEVVEARPDPIAERPAAPVALEERASFRVRSATRASAPPPPTSPRPRHVSEQAPPTVPPDVPEIVASSGLAFASPAPTASPSPSAAVPAARAVAGSRRPSESGGAAVSLAPSPNKTFSAVPRYRKNPPPDYPIPSRRRGEEGTTLIDVVVNVDGLPGAVSVQRSSGYPLLDRAALAAVRQWTFEPARVGGVPISSRVVVPVRFSLESR